MVWYIMVLPSHINFALSYPFAIYALDGPNRMFYLHSKSGYMNSELFMGF